MVKKARRGSTIWVSGSPHTDYADIPDPTGGDVFLYVASGDVFRHDLTEWVYVGVLGSGATP